MKNSLTKSFSAVFIICLVTFLSSCDKLPFLNKPKPAAKSEPAVAEVKGTALAKVNNSVITLEDFNKRIENIKKVYTDIKIDKFEDKKAFLNELVKRELLYQEAVKKGLDSKQDVIDAIVDFKREVLAAQLIDDQTASINVEAKEIEDYYNTFKDEFTAPEERKVREIIVPTEQKAKDILIELLKGQDFTVLATQNSISASSKNGGEVGFIKKGERQGKYDTIVFSLGAGEISNVFNVPEGYAIVKVEEKKGGESKSLSDAWNDIEEGLLRLKKYQQVLKIEDDLRAKASLEIREDLLR